MSLAISPTTPKAEKATFTRTADDTLARVRDLYEDRGASYGDTWALPNQKRAVTEYVLELPRERDYGAWIRLLQLAVMIDVKDSRLLGGGNAVDSMEDGIAFRASFTAHLRDYLEAI